MLWSETFYIPPYRASRQRQTRINSATNNTSKGIPDTNNSKREQPIFITCTEWFVCPGTVPCSVVKPVPKLVDSTLWQKLRQCRETWRMRNIIHLEHQDLYENVSGKLHKRTYPDFPTICRSQEACLPFMWTHKKNIHSSQFSHHLILPCAMWKWNEASYSRNSQKFKCLYPWE